MISEMARVHIDKKAIKVGCVFPIVVVSLRRHLEFGPNDHWTDAPHCILWV